MNMTLASQVLVLKNPTSTSSTIPTALEVRAYEGGQWQQFINSLAETPIHLAIDGWLKTLKEGTARNYSYYMSDLMRRGIVPFEATVGEFNQAPHEAAIDSIKRIEDWSEGTRQVRAAVYISFTAYLERLSRRWFRKAEPSTLAASPTFFQVNDKCVTKAMTLNECHCFLAALEKINNRDSLIARAMLQGAKRISEVLSLTLDQVDYDKCILHFRQLKTGGTIKEIPITYPEGFMLDLKEYIASTCSVRGEGNYVFITRSGEQVTRSRLNYSFKVASLALGWDDRLVNPHMLRATWVTLAKQQGVADTEIMKVTGHTSSKMVYSYDKTSAEDNLTKRLTLV